MLAIFLYVQLLFVRQFLAEERSPLHRQSGQGTVEYALVMLGAAALALLFGAWVVRTGRIGDLLDRVVDSISGKVA